MSSAADAARGRLWEMLLGAHEDLCIGSEEGWLQNFTQAL